MDFLDLLPVEVIYFDPDLNTLVLFKGEGVVTSPPVCSSEGLGVCHDLPGVGSNDFVSKCVAHKVIETGRTVETTQVFIEQPTGAQRYIKRFGFPAPQGGCFELRFEIKNEIVSEKQIADSNMQDNFRLIAGGINHELRSPLQAIHMYAEMMSALAPRDTKEAANSIISEIHKVTSILDSLGKFNRTDKSILEYEEFTDTMCNVWGTMEITLIPNRSSEIVLEFDPSDFSGIVPNIPKSELQQIFTNIFRNSIEATEKKVQGKVEVKLIQKSREFFSFLVRDNGCGIPYDRLAKIFTPFVTSKNGMGLGLTICRHFITMRGGTILILSEEGKYTDVIISLPLKED